MSKNRKRESSTADVLVVFLFFCGVALIAAGLWLASRTLCLVFLGISVLYLAASVNKAANPHERTVRK